MILLVSGVQLRAIYDSGALFDLPGKYGSMIIRKRFIDEGNRQNLLAGAGDAPINIHCPVILLHCLEDDVAPYEVQHLAVLSHLS